MELLGFKVDSNIVTSHAIRAPPHDLAGENNAQAGLLMQMFITYAQEQRADSNHISTDLENTG